MKISILISSYNKGNYLEKCILSCLNQKYKDYEVILIDNESTDETESILKKYKEHIIIRSTPKISKYSPVNQIDILNKALIISSGEIICFLDADDYFENNKLEQLNKLFSDNHEVSVIFDKPKILNNQIFNHFRIKKKFNKYLWPTTHPTSSISIKKSFIKKIFEDKILQKYPLLEIDFIITSLSKMIYKNFLLTNLNLTVYRKVSDGIMSKIKKYSVNWWKKRLQAHYFIFDIYKENEIEYKKNYDFYLTIIIVWLLNKIIK
jgi:glycosyltransferase involved in cell wall biosynthesis